MVCSMCQVPSGDQFVEAFCLGHVVEEILKGSYFYLVRKVLAKVVDGAEGLVEGSVAVVNCNGCGDFKILLVSQVDLFHDL